MPGNPGETLKGIWRTILLTFRIYGEIDGEQRAASFAYYVLFSLFPLFALILTIGSALFDPGQILHSIEEVLPIDDAQQEFIWKAVHKLEQARGGVGVVSVVILLWCSLRFFQALVRGVNRAWHTVEIPWWQVPLKNLLMLAVIGSGLLVGLLAPALLQGISNGLLAAEAFVHAHFPGFNLHLISMVLDLSRYALASVILFYTFSLLYMLAPRKRVFFRQVWLPALLVTLLLQVLQSAFVNYLPRLVNYNTIYGSLSGLLLLLLWVYFSGILIILGGCLCAAMDRVNGHGDPAIPSSSGN